jgi:hypothetical protein
VKDYIKMMLETEKLKFLVFAHHLTMLQACTEAVIEAKVTVVHSSQLMDTHTSPTVQQPLCHIFPTKGPSLSLSLTQHTDVPSGTFPDLSNYYGDCSIPVFKS